MTSLNVKKNQLRKRFNVRSSASVMEIPEMNKPTTSPTKLYCYSQLVGEDAYYLFAGQRFVYNWELKSRTADSEPFVDCTSKFTGCT